MSDPLLTYAKTHERERRHFRRIEVKQSGEFVWSTTSRLGRSRTYRQFVTTENLAVKGAKVTIAGEWKFEDGATGRFKLGTEFCEAEVLEVESNDESTTLRLVFIGPSPSFADAVQRYTTSPNDDRFSLENLWSS